jgi:hypothetical protein
MSALLFYVSVETSKNNTDRHNETQGIISFRHVVGFFA